MIKNCRYIDFHVNFDKYGSLVPIEGNDEIPFNIKRVYYIYNVENGVRRGFHSHIDLEQVLICVKGSVKVLIKTPFDSDEVVLNNPAKGLYIGPMVWREMFDFTEDAVLLVLASKHFDQCDYIRDYEKYEKMAIEYFNEYGD